jgi:hypothetical protein
MSLRSLMLLSLCCLPALCRGQDTLQYCEQRNDQDLNCYFFYPAPKAGAKGTVDKVLHTDQGEWFGTATYKATADNISVPSFHLYPVSYEMEGDRLVRRVAPAAPGNGLYVKKLVFVRKGAQLVLTELSPEGVSRELVFKPQLADARDNPSNN